MHEQTNIRPGLSTKRRPTERKQKFSFKVGQLQMPVLAMCHRCTFVLRPMWAHWPQAHRLHCLHLNHITLDSKYLMSQNMHGVWSTFSSSCTLASAVIILLRFLVVPVTSCGLGFGNNLLAFVDTFASSFCCFLNYRFIRNQVHALLKVHSMAIKQR